MHLISRLLALLLAIMPSTSSAKTSPANTVLLSRVKTLTLRHGQQTSARRVSAIPQLTCVGGNAQGLYEVDILRCKNAGSEYDVEDVQWTCQAALPPEFKLGSTEVVCEGYDSADDPYVLKGSCGAEYRLVLTEMGEEKYGRNVFERAYKYPSGSTVRGAFATSLFWLAFVGIACFILYKIFVAGPQHNPRRPGNGFFGGGGFGGGGGDNDDDPPPPYTPRAPKPSSSYRANQARNPDSQTTNGAWRPGFWSGAATGAAAGYAASALGGGRSAERGARAYQYDPSQPGPSTWFGRTREPERATYGGGARPASFGGPSASPSSSRYESTGFGGTRRR